MELLGETYEIMVLEIESEEEKKTEEKKERIEKIMRGELIEVVRKVKRTKAPEENGIENEAWRYMAKEIGEEFWRLVNKYGRKKAFRKIKGISSIYRRGDKCESKNYEGITDEYST